MADRAQRLVISDLSGGRNGVDSPTSPRFQPNQCVDAVNVDWWQTTFARKRNGSSTSSTTFGSGGPFTGTVSTLVRHIPGTDLTAAEEWAWDDSSTKFFGRKAGGTTFTDVTPNAIDGLRIGGNAWDVSAASFDGKLFLAYQSVSSGSRLHVWDPLIATVRKTGIQQATPPTVADTTGAGSYAAVIRYYRTRWIYVSGGELLYRSEPSTAVSITPSGTHPSVTITRPGLPDGEIKTHWEIEVSPDNTNWFQFFSFERGFHIATGTTTQTDANATTVYPTLPAADAVGSYTTQKAYRFIAADQGRLLGFGSYVSTDVQNRIEVCAVLGSRDIGDSERVDTTTNYYIDLDENDSGVPRGLAGPVFGNFYAFKDRQVWELTPTGDPDEPYRRNALSKDIGAVFHKAIVRADDAAGNAALYWLSHRGFYMYGLAGLRYIGRGVEDLILGPTSTINLAAAHVIGHGVYHADKRQVWWWVATGSNDDPNILLIYDVQTGGWSRFTGPIASARCSAMLPTTLGATMSTDLKPYVGDASNTNTIRKCDDSSVTADSGTAFQAYVDIRDLEPGGPGFYGAVGDGVLLTDAASGVTITATVIPDFDPTNTQTGTALLTATAGETRVTRRLEGSGLAGTGFVRVRLGDGAATSNGWTLHRLILPHTQQDAVSA